jgi:hypothetical protein
MHAYYIKDEKEKEQQENVWKCIAECD